MARFRKPDSDIETVSHVVSQNESSRGNTNRAEPTTGKLRLTISAANTTQHDRINMWLLKSLEASSKKKKLHRSFLPKTTILDEEQWARMVLKYWLLDEAATGPGDQCFSSNGAVDSDGMYHSQWVLFEDLADSGLSDFDEREDTRN
jgi:hypothetical protein